MRTCILAACVALAAAGGAAAADGQKPSWKPSISIYQPPPPEVSTSTVFRYADPQIIQKIIQLLDETDLGKLQTDAASPLLNELQTYLTDEGFRLKNRYTRLGVALSESLGWEQIKHIRVISEQNLKQRLTTVARWDHTPNVRSIALVALASLKDKNDIVYFREALWSRNIGIRHAAVQALAVWGYPEAAPILKDLMAKDDSTVIRLLAAKSLSLLRDPAGIEYIRSSLESKDWFVRSLAAKCLGEVGVHSDYEVLLERLSREQIEANTNEFVTAEISIAALKLFPELLEFERKERERKKKKPAPAPSQGVQESRPPPAKGLLFELEPLVVTAPRLRIPQDEPVDAQINFKLLKILQEKEDLRLDQDQASKSAAYSDLNSLVTPEGIGLKTRYTVLGYLLTEGLAGTRDFQIVDHLVRLAREGKTPDIRSYALVALAYSKDRNHLGVFQEALRRETSAQDRFAAVEALQIWGYPEALPILNGVVKLDASPIIRVYSAQAVWRMGDLSGKDYLIRALDDPDWLVRAMTLRYFGELGTGDDYGKVLAYFGLNQEKIVQAELCSALLRLYAKKQE